MIRDVMIVGLLLGFVVSLCAVPFICAWLLPMPDERGVATQPVGHEGQGVLTHRPARMPTVRQVGKAAPLPRLAPTTRRRPQLPAGRVRPNLDVVHELRIAQADFERSVDQHGRFRAALAQTIGRP